LPDYTGTPLKQHEVEFVERMNALGEKVEWISQAEKPDPVTGLLPSTSDFIWLSKGGRYTELKSTGTNPHGVARRISDAVKSSRRHGDPNVRKRNFVVDIGDRELPDNLRYHLEKYNINRVRQARVQGIEPHTISTLWVMTQGRLIHIDLK
jgi:hypothetical protein